MGVPQGCPDEGPQTGCRSHCWRPEVQKRGVSRPGPLRRLWGGIHSRPLALLVFPVTLTSTSVPSVIWWSVCVPLSSHGLPARTPVIGFRAGPKSRMTSPQLMTPAKTLLPNKAHSEVPVGRVFCWVRWGMELGGKGHSSAQYSWFLCSKMEFPQTSNCCFYHHQSRHLDKQTALINSSLPLKGVACGSEMNPGENVTCPQHRTRREES